MSQGTVGGATALLIAPTSHDPSNTPFRILVLSLEHEGQPAPPAEQRVQRFSRTAAFSIATRWPASSAPNVRQVRASVSRLRVLGWPIGFGPAGGYRLSWERSALEALLRKYRSQALAELRVVNRLKRLLQRWAA
jgi:hypothetical protein